MVLLLIVLPAVPGTTLSSCIRRVVKGRTDYAGEAQGLSSGVRGTVGTEEGRGRGPWGRPGQGRV